MIAWWWWLFGIKRVNDGRRNALAAVISICAREHTITCMYTNTHTYTPSDKNQDEEEKEKNPLPKQRYRPKDECEDGVILFYPKMYFELVPTRRAQKANLCYARVCILPYFVRSFVYLQLMAIWNDGVWRLCLLFYFLHLLLLLLCSGVKRVAVVRVVYCVAMIPKKV